MKEKQVVVLTVDEIETVLCQIKKNLDLDIDIPSIIERAKAGEQGKYHLQQLQIAIEPGKKAWRSTKELTNANSKISRWLMLGRHTVLRYIYADEEQVISRHL
jgi:hypothetical protein